MHQGAERDPDPVREGGAESLSRHEDDARVGEHFADEGVAVAADVHNGVQAALGLQARHIHVRAHAMRRVLGGGLVVRPRLIEVRREGSVREGLLQVAREGMLVDGIGAERRRLLHGLQRLDHLGRSLDPTEPSPEPPTPLRVRMEANQIRKVDGARSEVGGLGALEALGTVRVVHRHEAVEVGRHLEYAKEDVVPDDLAGGVVRRREEEEPWPFTLQSCGEFGEQALRILHEGPPLRIEHGQPDDLDTFGPQPQLGAVVRIRRVEEQHAVARVE